MSVIENLLAERELPPLPATREEMLETLAREEYGPLPPAPTRVFAQPVEKPVELCAGAATLEHYLLQCDCGTCIASFPIRCVFPKEVPDGGLPLFVMLNFRSDVPDRYLPAEEIAENGFAVISVCYTEVGADSEDGCAVNAAASLCRAFGKTSKISIWAWAASRALDWALQRGGFDAGRIAVIGHSRLGKTALWAGANDERFTCVISNDSGCCGAAISRGKIGEDLEAITRVFPHWSVDGFKQYANHEYDQPFDQHWLIAAVAPRKVCVGSAWEDEWADPASEYLSCCAASEAWTRMGRRGFAHPDRLPAAGDSFGGGDIGYHLRSRAHYLAREDWREYMSFLKNM